jgi:hypothetical protein
VLVDDRRRALQDFLASTVVVYDDDGQSPVETTDTYAQPDGRLPAAKPTEPPIQSA